jgi:hypothetical protein
MVFLKIYYHDFGFIFIKTFLKSGDPLPQVPTGPLQAS